MCIMKAVVIYEPGGPEKLQVTEVKKPEVKPGWSLVRVAGFGINHSEIFTRKGLSPSVAFPRILGIECVGTIEKTTDEYMLPVGKKMVSIMGKMGRAFDGGYAEFALLPNEQIYPIDSSLPWDELAAIPETGYTAFGSLKNLRITDVDKVLVRGATSGVGVFFVRLLKAAWPDVYVAGTSRSLLKADQLLEAGFDEVILDQNCVLQTEKSFTKVLELIGPATMKDTCRHIAEGGIVCSTGQLGGQWYLQEFDPIMDLPANGYMTSFYSGNVDSKKLQELFDYLEEYKVHITPEKVFCIDEIVSAHQYLEESHSFGKVVVLTDAL